MPDIHWTTTDPAAAVDDWYWCRAASDHKPYIKHVRGGMTIWAGEDAHVSSLGLEWWGPIPEPTGEVEETGNG